MVITCDIQFEQNPSGTYFNGQLVSGTVTLNVDKPTDVKGITLKLQGHAVTKWKERKFQRRQVFFGREDYMATTTYLLGSEESNKLIIQPGIHTYNYAYQLPLDCPTSYEGNFGYIRYLAKVELQGNWKTPIGFTRGFTVLKMVDLNFDTPALRLPSTSETYKMFCCGPCTTEPIKLELTLPQTGFVPGQNIPVTVLVINNSRIPVVEVRFALVMLVRYFSDGPTQQSRVEVIEVSCAKGDAVLRNCTRSLTQQLHVPATPPTCLRQCKLIQIAYQVEVEARMQMMHENQLIAMPVIIGNVPLRNVIQAQPRVTRSQSTTYEERGVDVGELSEFDKRTDSELPIVKAIVCTANEAIGADIPPPSYEESVHTLRADINEDEQPEFGACVFAPLYPVYDIPDALPLPKNGFHNVGYDNQNFQR